MQSGRQIVRQLIIFFGVHVRQLFYFWRTRTPGHLILGVYAKFYCAWIVTNKRAFVHKSVPAYSPRNFSYRAACIATRSSHGKAVCPSVCLSVCQTHGLWQNERNFPPSDFFNTIWQIIYPSFLRRRLVGGGDPFYLKFWIKLTPSPKWLKMCEWDVKPYITNQLTPTSVTLNDLERLYFTEFDCFAGLLRHSGWNEYRPILSAEYRLPLSTKTDPPCSSVSLR